jgi:hypothetical protein
MNKHLAMSLFVALVGCGDNAEPDPNMTGQGSDNTPVAIQFPASCMDAGNGQQVANGEYTLYVGGDEHKPWKAYCHNGDEFLSVNDDTNFGSYVAGGWTQGQDVRTVYTKLRIDPATLTIDITDQTFARSDGNLNYLGETITSMPLGVAMACAGSATYGSGNIDLTGTPFKIATQFVLGSVDVVVAGAPQAPVIPTGGSADAREGQWLEMWAQGECGFVGPTGITGNKLANGYVLKVEWFVPTTI